MGWSVVWPVSRWNTPDDGAVFNDLVAALQERDDLVPAGFVGPTGLQTVANFQYEIPQMLAQANAWRWWDRSRTALVTLANLLADTIGQAAWTYDLTAAGAAWTPPFPLVFNELRAATNGLTTLRRLAASAVSAQVDSVYDVTFGITSWPTQRAAAFAQFDGNDDGVSTGLAYDVGLSASLFDSGSDQQWYLDAQEMTLSFDTSALDGYTVTSAWLEFTTQASAGSTDYSDTFTAEATNAGGAQRGTFASDDYSLKSIELDVADVVTDGDTVLKLCSTRANTADRSIWSPPGPDYTSTYREGFDLGDTLRLVVEVQFDYRA